MVSVRVSYTHGHHHAPAPDPSCLHDVLLFVNRNNMTAVGTQVTNSNRGRWLNSPCCPTKCIMTSHRLRTHCLAACIVLASAKLTKMQQLDTLVALNVWPALAGLCLYPWPGWMTSATGGLGRCGAAWQHHWTPGIVPHRVTFTHHRSEK
jgi:hypothetical protein